MIKRTPISESTKQFIIEHPNMPQKKIAEHCGCSQQAVSFWARKLGIKKKSQLTDREIFVVNEYIKNHPFATIPRIAKELNMQNHRVRMAIAGISNKKIGACKVDLEELNKVIENKPKIRYKEIASIFKVSYQTARNAKKRLLEIKNKTSVEIPKTEESKLSDCQKNLLIIIEKIMELNPKIETIQQLKKYL